MVFLGLVITSIELTACSKKAIVETGKSGGEVKTFGYGYTVKPKTCKSMPVITDITKADDMSPQMKEWINYHYDWLYEVYIPALNQDPPILLPTPKPKPG